MIDGILLSHHFINRNLKKWKRETETISNGQLFKMEPETLNGVEKWAVFGQSEDENARFIKAQSRPNRFAVMIGGDIHY